LFAGSLTTVAVTGRLPFILTLAEVGNTVTATGAAAAVSVIVAEADFVVSATDVAFKVTVAGFGTAVGAV
jgi:CBS domain containing-hemolysin-like protein